MSAFSIKEERRFLREVRSYSYKHGAPAIRFGTAMAVNVLDYFQGTPDVATNVDIIV
jgi:hypothetical protein